MKIEERVIRTIEEQAWIDRAAVPIQTALRGALHRAPSVAGFLHGNWLGHPLHAALIPLPIGAFTTTMVLDIVELTGNRRHRRVADAAVIAGVGSALIAALPGLADWSHTLAFRGHFSTKSRRYSVTLGKLRRARRRWQVLAAQSRATGVPIDIDDLEHRLLADEEETTLVIGSWQFAGLGWATEGDAALAVAAAARAREYAAARAAHRH